MDFAFSDEQEMLRASARSFLADRFPPERIAELADSPEGWDEKSWREIIELGWVGLSAPESAGGAGMGFLEEAVLFESLGYALYPGPYFATVALSQPALALRPELFGRVLDGATATLAWVEPDAPTLGDVSRAAVEAEPTDGGWRLRGTKDLVVDLAIADLAIVLARGREGVGLWALEPASEARRALTTIDTTRRFGRLELADAGAELLAGPDDAPRLVAEIRLRALAAAALEAVGVAQFALDAALSYANERRQFDKPIGTYQAVSHKIADTYIETELARSLAYWAAWCVAEGDDQAAVAVPAAKAAATEAAVGACERSIQVHGGIGFTWEHVLHRYYKRAQWLEAFEGYGAAHRAAVGERLFDASA